MYDQTMQVTLYTKIVFITINMVSKDPIISHIENIVFILADIYLYGKESICIDCAARIAHLYDQIMS